MSGRVGVGVRDPDSQSGAHSFCHASCVTSRCQNSSLIRSSSTPHNGKRCEYRHMVSSVPRSPPLQWVVTMFPFKKKKKKMRKGLKVLGED